MYILEYLEFFSCKIGSVFGGGERAGKCHSSSATAVFMFTAGSHPTKRLKTRDRAFTKKDKALIHAGGGI